MPPPAHRASRSLFDCTSCRRNIIIYNAQAHAMTQSCCVWRLDLCDLVRFQFRSCSSIAAAISIHTHASLTHFVSLSLLHMYTSAHDIIWFDVERHVHIDGAHNFQIIWQFQRVSRCRLLLFLAVVVAAVVLYLFVRIKMIGACNQKSMFYVAFNILMCICNFGWAFNSIQFGLITVLFHFFSLLLNVKNCR